MPKNLNATRGPRLVHRSRAAVKHSRHKGKWTQQYRDEVLRKLQDPATPVVIRDMLVQEIQDYARLGGNVKGLLR